MPAFSILTRKRNDDQGPEICCSLGHVVLIVRTVKVMLSVEESDDAGFGS